MSSQGHPTNYAGSTGTFVNRGYSFSSGSLRDSSDWTSFKRMRMVTLEGPVGVGNYPHNPFDIMSNDRRLEYMMGKYQKGATGFGCTGCAGAAFDGNGTPYSYQYRQ
jgi:hypothetical protein